MVAGELHAVLEFQLIVVPAAFKLQLINRVRVLAVGFYQYVRSDKGGIRKVRRIAARPKAGRIWQIVAAGDNDTQRSCVGAVPIANIRVQPPLASRIELGNG